MKLAVLDQSPIVEGGTAAGANRETLELARHCGGLGYHRYWLAEHHNAVGLAGTAPEILIGRVASLTRHMRIGPGGVMLNHYSALEVAESFRMLETLHPGRIDLGLGRAPGSARPPRALGPTGTGLDIGAFPDRVADLLGFQSRSRTAVHPTGPSSNEVIRRGDPC